MKFMRSIMKKIKNNWSNEVDSDLENFDVLPVKNNHFQARKMNETAYTSED